MNIPAAAYSSSARLAEGASRELSARRELGVGPLVGAIAVALLVGYWRTARDLVEIWTHDPNYSHGFFVPLFSLYLVWSAKRADRSMATDAVARPERSPSEGASSDYWRGLGKVAIGLGVHVVASFLGYGFLDVLAFVCILRGATLLIGGETAHRRYASATLFLIFMARLPIQWYQTVARYLQNLVSVASAFSFEACGIPVCREGCHLHFPGYSLTVGEACSGMRQLTTAVALAFVLGHFFAPRGWRRATLLIASVPLAVVANCLRVVAAGFALRWCGPDTAEGVLHTLEGLATMTLVSLMLLALARLLAARGSHGSAATDIES